MISKLISKVQTSKKTLSGILLFAGIETILLALILIFHPPWNTLFSFLPLLWKNIVFWFGSEDNKNYIDVIGIVVNLVAFIGVAVLTVSGTTYVYRMQKREEMQRLEENLYLILNEMRKNLDKICHLKSEIKKFDNECKGEIGTRDALRKSVNLWKEFNFLRVSGDYLFNYHRYYYILAKNDKITFRTGEQVQLSCLEPVLERVQYMMQHQYDAAIELQAKMSTISYLFTEKASSRSKRWSIKKNSESSPIKIIDRTLRNEGMNVDVINDNDLNSIWFTYNDRNQFVKQLRFFVDGAEKLESEISRSKFLDSVSKKI